MMEESATYLEIVDEGREKQTKRLILLLGRPHFGPADAQTEAALQAISDMDRLERIIQRVEQAADWHDLLSTS